MWVQRFVSVGEFTNLFELYWSSIYNWLAHDILRLEGSCLSLLISSACYQEECVWEHKHGWVMEGWLPESSWVMTKISQVLHAAVKTVVLFLVSGLNFFIRNIGQILKIKKKDSNTRHFIWCNIIMWVYWNARGALYDWTVWLLFHIHEIIRDITAWGTIAGCLLPKQAQLAQHWKQLSRWDDFQWKTRDVVDF